MPVVKHQIQWLDGARESTSENQQKSHYELQKANNESLSVFDHKAVKSFTRNALWQVRTVPGSRLIFFRSALISKSLKIHSFHLSLWRCRQKACISCPDAAKGIVLVKVDVNLSWQDKWPRGRGKVEKLETISIIALYIPDTILPLIAEQRTAEQRKKKQDSLSWWCVCHYSLDCLVQCPVW